MNETESNLRKLERQYLLLKEDRILDLCYERCTLKSKPGSSLSGRESTCIENCQIKILNSYSFLFNVVKNGGVYRSSEKELQRLAL